MINKRENKKKIVGIAFMLVAVETCRMLSTEVNVMAEAQSGIVMESSAVWREAESFKGDLNITVKGLGQWIENTEILNSDEQEKFSAGFQEEYLEWHDSIADFTDEENLWDAFIYPETESEEPNNPEEANEEESEDEPEEEQDNPETESEEPNNPEEETEDEPEEEQDNPETESEEPNNPEEETEDEAEESNLTGQDEERAEYVLKICLSRFFMADEQMLPSGCSIEYSDSELQEIQTSSQVVSYNIEESQWKKEEISLTVPVILRPEYRLTQEERYPLCGENQEGAGILQEEKSIFLMEINEEESRILAEITGPQLNVPKRDFSIELKPQEESFKAGQEALYKIKVTNTGELPIENLLLKGNLSCPRLTFEWESAEGLERTGATAVLDRLEAGSTRDFTAGTLLGEGQESDLTNTITAVLDTPEGETIERQAEITNKIIPLKAAFTVKKTADRNTAVPGDTITYQICIQNTGERTLHSVISTERFINAKIEVHFLEKNGVTLNGDKTKALISSIKPGEGFLLEARATVPEKIADEELINEVTVKASETEEESISAQSSVRIATASSEQEENVSGTEFPETETGAVKSSNAATGDEAKTAVYLRLLVFAAALMVFWVCLLVWEKGKRKS